MLNQQILFFVTIFVLIPTSMWTIEEFHAPRHPEAEMGVPSKYRGHTIFKITPATVLAPNRFRIQNTFSYSKYAKGPTSTLQHAAFSTLQIEYAVSMFLSTQITLPFIIRVKSAGQKTQGGMGKVRIHTDFRWFVQQQFAAILRIGLALPTTSIKHVNAVGFNEIAVILEHENIFLDHKWFIDFTITSLFPVGHGKTRHGLQIGHVLDTALQFYFKKTKINMIIGTIFNGSYTTKNKVDGVIDPNHGGFNLIFGPLFSMSRHDFLWDIRIGFPVADRIFGIQSKYLYSLAISLQALF